MAIITTYVCDVSGKQGNPEEFVKINLRCDKVAYTSPFHLVTTTEKVIHVDVARKLNLVHAQKYDEVQPEPTLEIKLLTLLKDYVSEIAYESAGEACSNYQR